MPRLVAENGEILAEFGDEIITIGRAEYNAVCLDAKGVSKIHARIEPTEDGYLISDLKSTNGVAVNGERVDECVLCDGDVIQIGSRRITFEDEESAALVGGFDEDIDVEEDVREDVEEDVWEDAEEEEDEVPVAVVEDEEEEEGEWGEEEEEREWAEDEWEEEEEDEEWEEIEPEEEPDEYEGVYYRLLQRYAERKAELRSKIYAAVWFVVFLVIFMDVIYFFGDVGFYVSGFRLRPRVQIDTDFVVLLPRKPPQRVEMVPQKGPEVTEEAKKEAKKELEKVQKDNIAIPTEQIALVTIEGLLSTGKSRDFKPSVPVEDALKLVTPEKPTRFKDVMDDFALEIINVLLKERLLVVLIFDESLSLKDDRHYMHDRLDRVIDILNLNLKPTEIARLKWAVVSYGRFPRIWQTATDDMEKVRKAVLKVPVDTSGVENLIAALRYSAKALDRKSGVTFFVAVTDETGDDTLDDNVVEGTLKMIVKRKGRVYVFGRQANFSNPLATRRVIDPETGETFIVQVNGGPETAYCEFFSHDELFQQVTDLDSGFGMFVQSRFCKVTGGKFYMLTGGGPPYNQEKLEEYAPDLCSRPEYVKLRAKSEIRRELYKTVEGWESLRPSGRGENVSNAKKTIADGIEEAKKALAFCEERIRTLRRLNARSKEEKPRWRANYDLIYAQLCAFKYMLGEYIASLQRLGAGVKPLLNGNPFIGFYVRPSPVLVHKARDGKEAHQEAMRAFQEVIARHDGTPFARMAQVQMRQMHSFNAFPRYRMPPRFREERKQPPPPKEPPKV